MMLHRTAPHHPGSSSCRRSTTLGSTVGGSDGRPNVHAPRRPQRQLQRSPVQRGSSSSSSSGQLAPAAESASPVVGAAARPPPPPVGPLEWLVGGCTYRVSLAAGQLLRLQEYQDSYEYALLVPASMASILCDVLHRAVACVQGGNDGRPLDLHHHVLQGSRTFSCSLSFTPPPSGQAASVTVTVQEAGRSCVHLAVSTAALPAIQQLLQMLQQVAASVAAASAQDPLQQEAPGAAAALQAADSDDAAASSMQEEPSTAAALATAEAPALATAEADAEQPPQAAAEQDASPPGAAPAAAAAAVDAAAAAAGLTGAEILFAGILESCSLQEGLRFAQAATAEALGDSSLSSARMFHLAHLCLLWQKAPEYAAAKQRQALGLGDDAPDAEVLAPSVPLDAGVRRDVQAFVGMLCPLLQPQLAQLPRHVLQRILRAAHKAQAQLPGSFLAAWAHAAAGPSARGSWDTPAGLQAWLEATQQMVAVGQQQQDEEEELGQQPLPAPHSVLPLQWAVAGLQEAASSMRAHVLGGLMQESQLALLLQQQAPQQVLQQAAGEVDLRVLQQLTPLLLAAAGHHLGRQQLLWQPWPTHTNELQHDIAAVLRELLCSGAQLQLQLQEQDLLAEQPPEVLVMQRQLQEQLQQRMQQLVVAHITSLPAEQHSDAVQLVWSWLAAGGGAAQLSSSELAALLERLPSDDAAAAAHSAAMADGGAVAGTPTSLLGTVLLQHARGSSGAGSGGGAAALVGVCFRALQPLLAAAGPGGEHLPTELLCAAAQLSEAHLTSDCGLQPRWAVDSRHAQSSSSYAWAAFEPLVVSTAEAAGSGTAVAGADAAAQCVALLLLGVAPTQLLQAYIGAVGPDALSLAAPGICDLLWVLGGIMQHGLAAEAGSSRADLLRLAAKACSSLAVRCASAVTTRQLARATWGLAMLAGTGGFAAPQQMVAWLQRSWLQSSGELVARVQQLQAADLNDLTWALQLLRLVPNQEQVTSVEQQPSQQAAVPGAPTAEPAAVVAAAPGHADTPPRVNAANVHKQQQDGERQGERLKGAARQQQHRQQEQEQQEQSQSQQAVPPSVVELLQQIKAGGFRPTQKQALQQLLPVQQHMAVLPAADVLCCVEACFQHSVPVSESALLAAAAAAAQQQGNGLLPASFLLQLLSAVASSTLATGSGQQTQQLRQEALQLLPLLTAAGLAGLSAAALLNLLRDVYTLATGAAPPKAATLTIGSALFGTAAAVTSSSDGRPGAAASSTSAAAAAVDGAWLAAVATALEPKLLLLPHGSQVLQCLQLLQGLGVEQPAGTFVARALAAADALLDTFSGRGCLELLAAAAAAGRMPSQAQTTAILQHLVPLKLSPSEVTGGCRLLAALSIRPPVELLAHWFDITQAAAERLTPAHVQQLLWSCCVWQVLPPSDWLDAVLRALAPAGRLSGCAPATAAGICRSLWQLGVQPAPGFVAAVVAAAQHAMTTQQQQQQQQQAASSLAYDAESLSVLCHCLLMWQHESTPAWRAAVEQQAAAAMPAADGPSLLRLGIFLTDLASRQQDEQQQEQEEEGLDDEGLLPWQRAFVEAASGLLPADQQEAQLGVVQAAGGAGLVQLVPAWGLVILGACLDGVPSSSLPLLRALTSAVQAEAGLQRLTAWDLTTLLPALLELGAMLEQQAEEAGGPFSVLLVRQLEQEAAALSASGQALVKQAYQERDGAPSVALMMIPALAQAFGMDMPAQSTANLEASVAAAQAREQALQQALLLHAQARGGPAVPDHLLQGLDELSPHDGEQLQAAYADNPVAAAVTRRMQLLGGAVSDGFVLASLAGSS